MKDKLVREMMIPISNYATVHQKTSLLEAMMALEESQQKVGPDMHPYRAALVVNDENKIVGKIGHLAFLRAIEPRHDIAADKDKLTQANVSEEFIDSMMKTYELWDEDYSDIYARAKQIEAGAVMIPVNESVSEDATLQEAIHKIIHYKTLSMLVKRDNEITGIIRLSDIYHEVATSIKEAGESDTNRSET